MCVQRPAPPDLDHFAHLVGTGWFTDQTNIHPFARLFHVVQQGKRAVDTFGFLVTGDGQHDRPVGGRVAHEIHRSGGKGGNARFHVRRATAIHHTVFDFSTKRRKAPVGLIADGHYVGMPVEAKTPRVSLVAPAREQVADTAAIRPGALKPCAA